MIFRLSIASALILALAACNPTPSGYAEAPAVTKYLSEKLPTAKRQLVRVVAICEYQVQGAALDWYASVGFDDASIFHYKLNIAGGEVNPETPIAFQRVQTKSMRASATSYNDSAWDCFNHDGDYFFRRESSSLTAYVDKRVVVRTPFDDKVKLRLQRATEAIEMAVAEQKRHVPVETTWGIDPADL